MFSPHRFYSAPEVIRESGAPRALVYEALEDGRLRAIRRGRRWLVPGQAVSDWISSVSTRVDTDSHV